MAENIFMDRLADLTGLRRYYPREYNVELICDPLVGWRDGYIVAIGPEKGSDGSPGSLIRIFVRFSLIVSTELLELTLGQCRNDFEDDKLDLEYGNTASKFAKLYDDTPQTDDNPLPDYFVWIWNNRGPEPELPCVALLDTSINALKKIAPPLERRCEICRRAVSEITLRNGTPGYYCSSCQQKEISRLNKEALEYPTLPVNHRRGFVYGLVAALLTAPFAGYLGSLSQGRWLVLAAFLGSGLLICPVYAAIKRGAGNIDSSVMGLTMAMIVLEVTLANAAYYVFVAQGLTELAFGQGLIAAALDVFLQAPVSHVGMLIGMCFSGIFAAVQGGFRRDVPSPKVTFESLDDGE